MSKTKEKAQQILNSIKSHPEFDKERVLDELNHLAENEVIDDLNIPEFNE